MHAVQIDPVRREQIQQLRKRAENGESPVIAVGAEPVHQHQCQRDLACDALADEIERVKHDDHSGQIVRVDRFEFLQKLLRRLERREPHRSETGLEQIPQILHDQINVAHQNPFMFSRPKTGVSHLTREMPPEPESPPFSAASGSRN